VLFSPFPTRPCKALHCSLPYNRLTRAGGIEAPPFSSLSWDWEDHPHETMSLKTASWELQWQGRTYIPCAARQLDAVTGQERTSSLSIAANRVVPTSAVPCEAPVTGWYLAALSSIFGGGPSGQRGSETVEVRHRIPTPVDPSCDDLVRCHKQWLSDTQNALPLACPE
jgi:hypothetical protein